MKTLFGIIGLMLTTLKWTSPQNVFRSFNPAAVSTFTVALVWLGRIDVWDEQTGYIA